MRGAFVVTIALALVFLGGGFSPVNARSEPAPQEAAAVASYDIESDVRVLQELLRTLGYLSEELTGQWDEATVGALTRWQQAHGLAQTGELDDATLDALGGSLERFISKPRFVHVVEESQTLDALARRFGAPLAWIVRFNPSLPLEQPIEKGTEVIVPIQFPLSGEYRIEHLEVLRDRFLGTYLFDDAFAEVGHLLERIAGPLEDIGFDVERADNPIDGFTVRGRGVVLGRVVFSAQQSTGKTRVHAALLFTTQKNLDTPFESKPWTSDQDGIVVPDHDSTHAPDGPGHVLDHAPDDPAHAPDPFGHVPDDAPDHPGHSVGHVPDASTSL